MLPSIDLNTDFLFVSAAVALILTPGPDTVFVLTQGVSGGKRGGVAAALGANTGILVHTTAATLRIAALDLGTVGLLSGGVRSVFRTRPRLADGLRWASGSVLAGLGAALALESR